MSPPVTGNFFFLLVTCPKCFADQGIRGARPDTCEVRCYVCGYSIGLFKDVLEQADLLPDGSHQFSPSARD